MPELPDVELHLRALAPRIVREPLLRVRLRSPFGVDRPPGGRGRRHLPGEGLMKDDWPKTLEELEERKAR